MTELEKYELVNSAESISELQEAILALADENGKIQGREQRFDAEWMASKVKEIVEDEVYSYPNNLTRMYGIRQQALYLREYEKF
jgi:hypothetical protein